MVEEGVPDQLSQMLCCVSSGQVRKRADGWRTCDANVGVSSEYLIGSDNPGMSLEVARRREA